MLLRRDIPFVRIAIAFAIGVLLYRFLLWNFNWAFVACLLVFAFFIPTSIRRSSFILPPIVFMIFFTITGYLTAHTGDIRNSKYYFQHYVKDNKIDAIAMVEDLKLSKTRWQIQLKLQFCDSGLSEKTPCTGKIIAYAESEALDFTPEYGQIVLLKSNIYLIESPKNPHTFNYKSLMEGKGVFHQSYIRDNQIKLLKENQGNLILKVAGKIRKKCLSAIDQHIKGDNEKAVIAALSLGYKNWLGEDIRNQYADTGAMHVLAVSGLHTGIIAGMMFMFTGFIKSRSIGAKSLRLVLCLAGVWSFAIVAGLAPSVMRAATMFSFILFAKTFLSHRINNYNVVALSAFILMFLNPSIIYQVGFQLSYSAVLGIMTFQDKIYKLIYPGTFFLSDKVWQLVTVSTAAQLGTLPLTIWYFHIFPTYFWLSGLFVVPLAAVLLTLSIVFFLAVAINEKTGGFISYFLEFFTWLMNKLIYLNNNLPYLKSEGLWITHFEFAIICASIITLALFLHQKRAKYVLLCLSLITVLMISFIIGNQQLLEQEIITVYQSRKEVIVDYFEGKTCFCFTDADPSSIEFTAATSNNRSYHGIKHCKIVNPDGSWRKGKVQFNNNRLSIEGKLSISVQKDKVMLESLVDVPLNFKSSAALLISNGQNSEYESKRDREMISAKRNEGLLWSLSEKGALYLSLKGQSSHILLNRPGEN